MKDDKIIQVSKKYLDLLTDSVGEPEERSHTPLRHLAWMCTQIPVFISEKRKDKAHRWLGFIQGVLWTSKIYSIDEMTEHNRRAKQR